MTNPLSQLFKQNFEPLVISFEKEMNRLKKYYHSWSGRLAAYKMFLLPKLLYLFRALLIQLPVSFYNNMQRSLSKFIWDSKKARTTHSILIKHRKVGGMGIPDIRDYHIAAILDQLKFWFNAPELKDWRTTEQAQVEQGDISDLLLSTAVADLKQHKQHSTIEAT